jgi:flagellar hook assembly protein FlgD
VTNDKGQTTSATVQINVTQGTPAASSAQLKLSTDTLHPQQGDTVDVQTTLGTDATVKVFLKNQAGQAIRTLASGVQRSAGEYKDTWDGKDDSGNVVAEGLYYAVLQYTGAAGTQTLDLSATTGGDQITFDPALTKNWTVTALDGTDCNNYPGCTISPYSNNFMQLTFQLDQALITTAAIRLWNSGTQVAPLFENKPFGRGSHTIYWEGTDQQGNLISPPPYDSFSLSFGGFTLSQNAVFVEEAPQFSNVVASPNYLEPFTGSSSTTSGQPTTISFTLSKPATVALQVFSVDSGALLQTIAQTNVSAGSSTIAWDGRADNGMFASQGSYRLALRAVDSQGNRSIIRYVLVKVFY